MYGDETLPYLDTDGDGLFDTLVQNADLNGDGYFETMQIFSDTNNDGIFDYFEEHTDTDGDGTADLFITGYDVDGDYVADVSTAEQHMDIDGDGYIDTVIFAVDEGSDGIFESIDVYQDIDGSGAFELVYHEDEDSALIIEPIDYTPATDENFVVEPDSLWDMYENFDPSQAEPEQITGDPQEALELWEWQDGNTCALHSQRIMIEYLTDLDLDIEEMEAIARAEGVYDGGGTNPEDLAYMLDYYNIENSGVCVNGSIEGLVDCLNNGGVALVGVDADILWGFDDDGLPGGHAVSVIGYDAGDPNDPNDDYVIINDTGVPDGQGAMIPVSQFEEAWAWSDNIYVEAYAA